MCHKVGNFAFYLFFRPENLTVPYVGTVSIDKNLIDPAICIVTADGEVEIIISVNMHSTIVTSLIVQAVLLPRENLLSEKVDDPAPIKA